MVILVLERVICYKNYIGLKACYILTPTCEDDLFMIILRVFPMLRITSVPGSIYFFS